MTVPGPSKEYKQWVQAIVYMIDSMRPEFANEREKTGFALKTDEIKRWTGTV